MKKLLIVFFVIYITSFLSFVGCDNLDTPSSNNKEPIINDAYEMYVAGKTFQPKSAQGSLLTFYSEGIATYDYFDHHYGYIIQVVETTDTHIKMHLKTVVIQSDDYIEREFTEATYNITDNTLYYFQPYVCLYDPSNSDCFSNAYGTFNTICAKDGCRLFIAASGNTRYCPEHAVGCKYCYNYLDPGSTHCNTCPHCINCGIKIDEGSGSYCSNCKKTGSGSLGKPQKCIVCNGTGYMKCYYGSSDLEAYLTGHDPYWYIKCTSCDGKGVS